MGRTKRSYVQTARQQSAEQTRARIVDAVVALHEEVGPSRTTIAAIADRAGVQRLTVYRHFPDEASLLAACSHRYTELNPPPHPSAWADAADAKRAVQMALHAIFDYYQRTAPMLERIYRDADTMPALSEIMEGFDAYMRGIADDLARRRSEGEPSFRLILTLRHLVQFSTWQSLHAELSSSNGKVDVALVWVEACL